MAFSTELFGWEAGSTFVCVESAEKAAATVSGAGGSLDVEPPHWSVEFWVRDADATAELADDLGGGVLVPPTTSPRFRETVLADPQGAVFKVSQLTAGSN